MSDNRKFLLSVARFLMERTADHSDTLLVFPNKRAIIFMRRYLKRFVKGAAVLPAMRTIGAFYSTFVNAAEASRVEQIFTLYDAYCEVALQKGLVLETFERFRFWGEMMLDDFNDIDNQLANPKDVFTNVKKLEEIQVDFLDEEQREVARELFGYEPAAFEGFKNNLRRRNDGEEDDIVYDRFVRLSEMLYPIYVRFNEMLEQRGIATRGTIARRACAAIETVTENPDILPGKIGFVGFDILSGVERRIFKTLRNVGRAEFFWDIPDMLSRDLPESMQRYRSPLSKYIEKITAYFSMPEGFELPSDVPSPEISILSVPSHTMQSKVAGNILEQLKAEKSLHPKLADDTVIVLPDTSLLIPLLHSVNVSKINVTMGMPIRYTPFATLLSQIIRLNMSARTDAEGDTLYLTENVVRILSHPSLTTVLPGETERLRNIIENKRRFMTGLSLIKKYAPSLVFVFEPTGTANTAKEAKDFLMRLIDGMLTLISETDTRAPEEREKTPLHEYRVLEAIRTAVARLVEIVEEHSQYLNLDIMTKMSFFKIVEKQLFHEQINFSGSPLTGVQIMGALETRTLDFNNVIMLSMNEKTFPPKNFMRSLIPAAIRAGYGLTTPEMRELEYAWIYAGLLSRCRKAFLAYNSAAETKGNGGMSRYLFQTLYIYNRSNPVKIDVVPEGKLDTSDSITVEKTEEVRKMLDRFRPGGDMNLSVSALEKYGACPLRFYLSVVRGVAEPKVTDQTIDDATYGSMVHNVMQQLYNKGAVRAVNPVDFTPQSIKQMLADELVRLWKFDKGTKYIDLPHEARMQIDLWTRKIVELIAKERERASTYTVYKCEMSPEHIVGTKAFDWHITDDLTVRFTFFIDRVDRLNDGTLRFVDYKTGKDKLDVPSMENLFWELSPDGSPIRSNNAIFQLLTYGNAYIDLMKQLGKPYEGDIKIEITKVLQPDKSIGESLKCGDLEFDSIKSEAVKDFREKLNALVGAIFDPNKNFTQTENVRNCLYCQFKNICRRNNESGA